MIPGTQLLVSLVSAYDTNAISLSPLTSHPKKPGFMKAMERKRDSDC